ncbi:MAG: N-acetyltransferase GCN5 [Parcubacteria group bacterium Licking1014_1]|nr:MAG: N-acetyltransferase GCN5 [Parcubacteria group bacterium Licking1014_1]
MQFGCGGLKNKDMKIFKFTKKDIKNVVKIASQSFFSLKEKNKARKWIQCNFRAYPRLQYFVAKINNKVVGYILWLEKGGFRNESVWELEQIAVDENYRGQGIGAELINKSLEEIKKYLKKRKSTIKLIEITTGTENKAQKLYEKTLGAQIECIVKNFFRGDEVIMIVRYK